MKEEREIFESWGFLIQVKLENCQNEWRKKVHDPKRENMKELLGKLGEENF